MRVQKSAATLADSAEHRVVALGADVEPLVNRPILAEPSMDGQLSQSAAPPCSGPGDRDGKEDPKKGFLGLDISGSRLWATRTHPPVQRGGRVGAARRANTRQQISGGVEHGSRAGTERAKIAPNNARALVRARSAIYEKAPSFPNDFSLDGGGRSRSRTCLCIQIP